MNVHLGHTIRTYTKSHSHDVLFVNGAFEQRVLRKSSLRSLGVDTGVALLCASQDRMFVGRSSDNHEGM
jgi:hypothetical protein